MHSQDARDDAIRVHMFEDAACAVAASRVDAQSTGAAPVYSKQVFTKLCILE